jgi:NAD/NADP transhydrogenase alpha subunit
MKIGVCKEIRETERRRALRPEVVRKLTGRNHEMPAEPASSLYARNVTARLRLMIHDECMIALDLNDDVLAPACVIGDGATADGGATSTAVLAQGG